MSNDLTIIDAEIVDDEEATQSAGLGLLKPEFLPATSNRGWGRQPSYQLDPSYGMTDYLMKLRDNYLQSQKERVNDKLNSKQRKQNQALVTKYGQNITGSTASGDPVVEKGKKIAKAASGDADAMYEVTEQQLAEVAQQRLDSAEAATDTLKSQAERLADAAVAPPPPEEGSSGSASRPQPTPAVDDKHAKSDRMREAIRHPLGTQERLRMLSLSPYDISRAYGCSEAETCRSYPDFVRLGPTELGIVHLQSERTDANKLKVFKSISGASISKLTKPALEAINEHLTNFNVGAL